MSGGAHGVGDQIEGRRSRRWRLRRRPDVTLVDVDLGEESGLDLTRRLAEAAPGAGRVVLISAYSEADLRDLVDASPAVGFLPESRLSSRAIRELVGLAGGAGGDVGGDVGGDLGT